MKKLLLICMLISCFLSVSYAQKTTVYCTVEFYGVAGAVDYGVMEDKVPDEEKSRIKKNLKKVKTYAEVITIMSTEGWEYVDNLPLPSTSIEETYLLFKRRD